MPKGPRGERRPTDPIKSGTLVMRIATGELTEEDARKLAKRRKVKSKVGKTSARTVTHDDP